MFCDKTENRNDKKSKIMFLSHPSTSQQKKSHYVVSHSFLFTLQIETEREKERERERGGFTN